MKGITKDLININVHSLEKSISHLHDCINKGEQITPFMLNLLMTDVNEIKDLIKEGE
ncbi:hypothetical protein [Bacillus phage SWEP1]|nr:hypothetical protein [Bacillus phage SWEP1]